jgi:hypothetical protein
MNDEIQNERAQARSMARASWGLFSRGARRHSDNARAWVRAEGLEALIKERDARALEVRAAREARARSKRGKRARAQYSAPPRAITDLEIKARAFGTRTTRSLVSLAIPCALIAYPPYALMHGEPLALFIWPAAYGYLVWDGWAHRSDAEADEDADELPMTVDEPGEPEVTPTILAEPQHVSGLNPTAQESAIIHRITSWADHAAERKLQGVIPGLPLIDESGLLIPIGFAGTWTPGKLDEQVDQVRALLAVPDKMRTQVKPGGTADRALIRVRTRTRALDLTWSPERSGIGLDADTAEVVQVNTDERLLVAGTSGSGKSVALRVLMAEALSKPHAALVILDLKRTEGALWRHTARVESEPEGVQAVVDELIEEMKEREIIMERGGIDLWEPTDEKPNITVAVDEGAELIAEVPDSVSGLRSLARRARAAGIRLWWATQKPTMTGAGPGLDSQIAGQLTTQVCLAVAGSKESRVVLGEDATGKGWHAEDLEMGGWALVRTGGKECAPDPVRVWFMKKEDVKALPARTAWRREVTTSIAALSKDVLGMALSLSEGLEGVATSHLAKMLGITDVEVHRRMSAYGAKPEPNAFAIGNGERMRGYRRSVLEDAEKRRKE